jgi:hypothetical protein
MSINILFHNYHPAMSPILKKLLCFVIVIPALNAHLIAQPVIPHIEWAKSFGGSDIDQALCIEQTSEKGFIIAGLSNSNDGDVAGHHGTTDFADYWIVKLDSNTNLQWQRSLGGDKEDHANCIRQTKDGGYVVAGFSASQNGDVTLNRGLYDYWVVKLDDNGKIVWQKTFGGSDDDVANDIEITSDSGYIVAGFSYSIDGNITNHHGNNTRADYWIIKLDKNGNIQWQKSYGGTDEDRAKSVRQTADHGYIVAGESHSTDGDVTGNHGFNQNWVIKIDSIGNIQWEKTLGGNNLGGAFSLEITSDRGFIIAGYSASTDSVIYSHHLSDFQIIKLDSVGAASWEQSFGGSGQDAAYSIKQTFDGGYIAVGYTGSNDGDVTGNHGGDDYWIVKLDKTGNLQWQKTLGGTGEDFGLSIIQTSDSSFVVAGSSDSDDGDITGNHGHEDYWIVKLGNKPVNDVNTSKNNSAVTINFPNPFSDKTQIQFGKIVEAPSEFILYNVLGEEVRKMTISPGTESTMFYRGKLVSGVYVYHLVSNGIIIGQGRMIIH